MLSCINVSKLIKLNAALPIYDKNNCDIIIGYTEPDDLAVITYASSNSIEGYYETIIVSGKYIGIDTLALNDEDLMNAIFILNKMNEDLISCNKANYEIR